MFYSPENLSAFVESARLGSFSAAARRLGKGQSTISAAIANMETDLGVILFDRSGRNPTLTDAGRKVLAQVREIELAGQRLTEICVRLCADIEPKLTLGLSDLYHLDPGGTLMHEFDELFSDIELQCVVVEAPNAIALVRDEKVHLAVIEGQSEYPADIASRRLPRIANFALYVGRTLRPTLGFDIEPEILQKLRRLELKSCFEPPSSSQSRTWSAGDYMMLMEMCAQGFGLAELPSSFVARFGTEKVSRVSADGWPRQVNLDVIWSRRRPPGRAGLWLLDRFSTERA